MRTRLLAVSVSLLLLTVCSAVDVPAADQHSRRRPLAFCGEFDPGHGGAYNLALNEDATRLFVVGEAGWLDALDTTDPSVIRSISQAQFEGLPCGEDGKYGICYDPHFRRLVAGGGVGTSIFLIDASGDPPRLLDVAIPPETQFPDAAFPPFQSTPPIFIREGTAVAAAMMTGHSALDPSSGESVFFGEGVYILRIDPDTLKMSVVKEGIGGFSTIYSQCYEPHRHLLWCGGQDGAEATIDLSHVALDRYCVWSRCSGAWPSRILPDALTHDGKYLVERVASRFPADHWFVRVRQIEALDGSYALWNAAMPTDGTTPHLLGSPIDWDGDAESPGSRISDKPLLPCILTHDERFLLTAEAGGSEFIVLNLLDKAAEPELLFAVSVGDAEQIQSIKGYRNRFYISLKSGRILVYEWNYVEKPGPPMNVTAISSDLHQSISLSWDPPSTGPSSAGYNVYRRHGSEQPLRVGTTTETTWMDHATSETTTYIYTVRSFAPAHNPLESSDSHEADASTPSGVPPGRVRSLLGESTLGGVTLTWSPNPEADVLGYHVYRKTNIEPFARITSSLLTESGYLDLNLNQGQEYSYYVAAVDENGEGEASESVTLFPGTETANLLHNPGAEEQSTRYWTDASTAFPPDPANRYSWDNDLFIAVTSGRKAEGQWAFWADRTAGRYDRLTQANLNETYSLAAYQEVDVAAFSDAIECPERQIIADWGGCVFRAQESFSIIPFIAIECLDADGVVLERRELSSETATEWGTLSSSDRVPSATRHLRFWMFANEVTTSPAQAAWDDLWVILREEQPPEPLAATIDMSSSGLAIRFGPTALGKSYQIEYADALFSNGDGVNWTACGPVIEGDGATTQWCDTSDEQVNPTSPPASEVPRRFYRVREH